MTNADRVETLLRARAMLADNGTVWTEAHESQSIVMNWSAPGGPMRSWPALTEEQQKDLRGYFAMVEDNMAHRETLEVLLRLMELYYRWRKGLLSIKHEC